MGPERQTLGRRKKIAYFSAHVQPISVSHVSIFQNEVLPELLLSLGLSPIVLTLEAQIVGKIGLFTQGASYVASPVGATSWSELRHKSNWFINIRSTGSVMRNFNGSFRDKTPLSCAGKLCCPVSNTH